MLSADNSVSVIIPVHNGERFLGMAIDSVLRQSNPATEIIVVDDGSTDGSAKIAQAYTTSVKYIFQEKRGAAQARNTGVMAANQNFISFLDADDLWLPNKLEQQLITSRENPGTNAVFGLIKQFKDGSAESISADEVDMAQPGYLPSTLFISKKDFLHVGLFETTWELGEFIAWFARAQDLGIKSAMVPHIVALRRIHDQNQGVLKKDRRSDYALIVKSIRDRRCGSTN